MSDLTLARVRNEVKGKHSARLCANCRRSIKYGSYKGQVYRADFCNDYAQTAIRYACWQCARKALLQEYKDIPDRIKLSEDSIVYLKERRIELKKLLKR